MKKSRETSEKGTKTWSFHRDSSAWIFHFNSSFASWNYDAFLIAFLNYILLN